MNWAQRFRSWLSARGAYRTRITDDEWRATLYEDMRRQKEEFDAQVIRARADRSILLRKVEDPPK